MSILHVEIQRLNRPQQVAVYLVPRIAMLPLSIQRYDDPFLPFSKAVINASRAAVSVYIFDVAAYLTLGGAGAVALERTIDYLNDEIPCVLHGAFASLSFTSLLDKTAFGASAITLGEADPHQVLLMAHDGSAVGRWHITQGQLEVNGIPPLTLKVLGDDLVYKSRRDDFEAVIRNNLEML